MSKPNYRVVLSFDSGRKVFVARAPELDPCSAEGPTRKEAIAGLEEEIDAQLANMLAHGSTPPRSVDEDEQHSGELTVKISKTLHKELAYTARHEGIELAQLVSELLASAHADRRPNKPRGAVANQGERNGNRGGYGNRGNNMALLDDRANFIEYVRNLDSGNASPGNHQGPRGPGGGGHNRGPGGGGHRGGGGGGRPGGGGGGGRHDRGGHRGGGGRPGGGGGHQGAARTGPPPQHAGPSGGGQGGNGGGGRNDEE